PLADPLAAPPRRAAVRAPHADADPGADPAPARRARHLRPAAQCPGLRAVRRGPLPLEAPGRRRTLAAPGAPARLRRRVARLAERSGTRALMPRDPERDPEPDARDRDAEGRARNARPRDAYGRPLRHGEPGEPTTSDEEAAALATDPRAALAE